MPSLWTLGNDWISVTSSFVRAIQFEEKEVGTGDLRVEYIRGAICRYENISTQLAINLLEATSKGKNVHAAIYHLLYTLERPAKNAR